MEAFSYIMLGLLVGWLIEWLIDWLYWRKKHQTCQDELNRVKAQNERLQEKLRRGKKGSEPAPDDFSLIGGIGPVISDLLVDAGITTFEQLAKKNSQQLRSILGDQIENLADEDDLLKQAKAFAREKKLARTARKKGKKKKTKDREKSGKEVSSRSSPGKADRSR